MKKFGCFKFILIMLAIIAVVTALMFWILDGSIGKMFEDGVLSGLPEPQTTESYRSDGEENFVCYRKYIYGEDALSSLESHQYLKKVAEEDQKKILSYIDDFEKKVADRNLQGFDFNRDSVDADDYFYFESTETYQKIIADHGEFSVYTLYFFDADQKILHYIHYNI